MSFVGSLEQLYKGPDVLIRAVRLCAACGIEIKLRVIGDGRYRQYLEALAHHEGVSAQVLFTGALPPGDSVRECLDNSDMFVLPSRTEGMPRALLEAMARGLPCIGSSVGGIPELLPQEVLVTPGDEQSLARVLMRLAADVSFRDRLGRDNRRRAMEFRSSVLAERRNAFLLMVKERTGV